MNFDIATSIGFPRLAGSPQTASRPSPHLRQGELFGLTREDIDFDQMIIHVRRQVKRLGRYFVLRAPEERHRADVPMSDGAGSRCFSTLRPSRRFPIGV